MPPSIAEAFSYGRGRGGSNGLAAGLGRIAEFFGVAQLFQREPDS